MKEDNSIRSNYLGTVCVTVTADPDGWCALPPVPLPTAEIWTTRKDKSSLLSHWTMLIHSSQARGHSLTETHSLLSSKTSGDFLRPPQDTQGPSKPIKLAPFLIEFQPGKGREQRALCRCPRPPAAAAGLESRWVTFAGQFPENQNGMHFLTNVYEGKKSIKTCHIWHENGLIDAKHINGVFLHFI